MTVRGGVTLMKQPRSTNHLVVCCMYRRHAIDTYAQLRTIVSSKSPTEVSPPVKLPTYMSKLPIQAMYILLTMLISYG